MIKIIKNEEAERRVIFCNNLRFIIRNGPIKVKDVARKVGVSPNTISTYMLGRSFPSEERIQQIADALGVTVEDLFDDSNPPWKFDNDQDGD